MSRRNAILAETHSLSLYLSNIDDKRKNNYSAEGLKVVIVR